jgi:hypothetical protein
MQDQETEEKHQTEENTDSSPETPSGKRTDP